MGTKKFSEVKQELISVPPLIGYESPASWIARAALSQGVKSQELMKLLGLSMDTDVDLGMSMEKAQRVAIICGLQEEMFKFSVRMFSSVRSVDSDGRRFLLPFGRKGGLYRYCPGCLHDQRIKHFPLHWRFKGWKYCPIHECLMEERCLNCGVEVRLTADMLFSGPENAGVAFLDRCLGCEHRLSSHCYKVGGLTSGYLLKYSEREMLRSGRATLSAFYYGYFVDITSLSKKQSLRRLWAVSHAGGFDGAWIGLDNRELLRRKNLYQNH